MLIIAVQRVRNVGEGGTYQMSSDVTGSDENLVAVYRAPDEATANIVAGLLESEGIQTAVRSRQVPMLDGVMVAAEGGWGEVVVAESQLARSRQVVAAYESAPTAEDFRRAEEAEELRPWSPHTFLVLGLFGIALTVAIGVLVSTCGYDWQNAWPGIVSIVAGLTFLLFLKIPVHAKRAWTAYCLAYEPVGAALVLAGLSARGYVAVPLRLFHGLCLVTVLMLAYVAVTGDRQRPRERTE